VPVPADKLGELPMPRVCRGVAYADMDGDLDIVLTQPSRPAVVLRNDQSLRHHWLRVKLLGTESNRDAIGAAVELPAAGATQRRRVVPQRSYMSSVEVPMTLGLGTATTLERLRITWPSGLTEQVASPGVDHLVTIIEGQGKPIQASPAPGGS